MKLSERGKGQVMYTKKKEAALLEQLQGYINTVVVGSVNHLVERVNEVMANHEATPHNAPVTVGDLKEKELRWSVQDSQGEEIAEGAIGTPVTFSYNDRYFPYSVRVKAVEKRAR